MNTLRTNALRFASTTVLAAVVILGAQAFVPTAFGCSTGGNQSDCRDTTTGGTNGGGSRMGTLSTLQMLIDSFAVLLP